MHSTIFPDTPPPLTSLDSIFFYWYRIETVIQSENQCCHKVLGPSHGKWPEHQPQPLPSPQEEISAGLLMPLSHLECRASWEAGSYKMSHAFISHCCSLSRFRLCNPVNGSTPGFPVLHCLLEFAQTHVHWVGDDSQPSHPLSPPSPLALNLSLYLGLFHALLKLKKNWLHWVFMAASRLSCPAACGILVPRPGMEPTFPAREGGFLTTGPQEKSHPNTFKLWKPYVTSGKIRFYRTRIPLQ